MTDSTDAKLHATALPAYLRERHAFWHATRFSENRAWYQRLAHTGQHPRAMVISCCDSRVDSVQMFGAEPGDLFVLRNVASLVPPHSPDLSFHGTSAAVEYAVSVLKVAHLVVVGHSNCGGISACHDMCAGSAPQLTDGSSYIGRWIDILRPGFERVSARIKEPKARVAALEKEGVIVSIRNLISFPFVAEAMREGELTLHGCWIDIGSGELHVLDHATGEFV
ncbi:carbonic anhydrase [Limibaculum sp. M0105]|uniref:Carbonic anhydrase n=1 Tax=Thermohalobaculum xanthum TaxID=2753746 RepID=A0A8J7M958_9RHOB|nr:carbonic anhydrase [Thermohalobaculum xanthum]MBK0400604.1 carbonic anhydrase [Thermohalobaculum xanthum]